jgi:hypothetical protein
VTTYQFISTHEVSKLEFLRNNLPWVLGFALVLLFIMFLLFKQSLSDWWSEQKLEWKRNKLRKKFSRKFAELQRHKPNDREAYEELLADEHFEEQMQEEYRNCYYSDRLLRQAPQYDVEVPLLEETDMWKYSDDGERNYLTLKGRDQLRDRINKAKDLSSADWERRNRKWVPILSLLIALASILLAFRK